MDLFSTRSDAVHSQPTIATTFHRQVIEPASSTEGLDAESIDSLDETIAPNPSKGLQHLNSDGGCR